MLPKPGAVLINIAEVSRAPVVLGLAALAAATATYFALLFTIAQYFQQGLGRTPVASALMLVPWVAAFGLAGQLGSLMLAGLLAIGGFGLGTQFSTLIGHVMGAVPARFASDISGVTSTVIQVGGVVGFGGLYLTLAHRPGPARAVHSFALTTLAFAVTAAIAAVTAWLATRTRADAGLNTEALP